MAKRELPGHIAAALAAAGGPADSAGVPWAGRSLEGEGNPLHQFDKDDGQPDAGYTGCRPGPRGRDRARKPEWLSRWPRRGSTWRSSQRSGEEADSEHGLTADKEADLALVTLTAPDGRKALPVFSSVDALSRWHPGGPSGGRLCSAGGAVRSL